MPWGSTLLILGLALLAGLFLIKPFLDKSMVDRKLNPSPVEPTLDEQKESSKLSLDDKLTSLQELDYDRETEKINLDEYESKRSSLLKQAAAEMRRLDALNQSRGRNKLRVKRITPVGKRPSPEEDEIETLVAARRRQRAEKSSGFCPRCSQVFVESDVFCSQCGYGLGNEVTQKRV